MKKLIPLIAIAFTLVSQASVNAQGTLTPTGAPAPTQKSLQEIWDRLETLSQSISQVAHQSIPTINGMIPVIGGELPQNSTLSGQKISTFYIGKYEVTWSEWQEIRTWGVSNGYTDLAGVGAGVSGEHPVRDLNWYECVKWCNAKSEKEGLIPAYSINGTTYKIGSFGANGSSAILLNDNSNGYRLPTESEWEWATRGGLMSKGYTYSGSNNATEVGWYFANSLGVEDNLIEERRTWPVGQKKANELGIFDMMGNVVEWCWTASIPNGRRLKGGSFDASPANVWDNAHYGPPDSRYFNQGFRFARSYK